MFIFLKNIVLLIMVSTILLYFNLICYKYTLSFNQLLYSSYFNPCGLEKQKIMETKIISYNEIWYMTKINNLFYLLVKVIVEIIFCL